MVLTSAPAAPVDRLRHQKYAPVKRNPAPHIPPRRNPAHRIAGDAEAIAVAKELAAKIAVEAAERDRERRLPITELDWLSESGLLAITVPKEFGGAGASNVTLARVAAVIAAADGSLGQIPQNHFYMVEALRLAGSEEQRRRYFRRVLDGDRLGNAFTEIGTRTAVDFQTRITPDGSNSRFVLNGQKFYSTGAAFAHLIPVVAADPDGRSAIVFLERNTPGLEIIDDWSGFGQRTTGSGSTYFNAIEVEPSWIVPHQDVFDRPTPMGPIAQILHAAVEVGIARGALEETVGFVRAHARPWFETDYAHGYEDVHVIHAVGDLATRVVAAEALLEPAREFIDAAVADPTDESVARASIAVAEVKAYSTEVALQVASKLFELSGSRSTLSEYGYDRYWRNARVHTLHDPVRWKYHHIGNFWLNGIKPPRHGAL